MCILHLMQYILTCLQVEVPAFSIHNIEEASQVFEDLYQSRITGRAILKLNHSQNIDN